MSELRYLAATAAMLVAGAATIGFVPVGSGLSDVAVRGVDLTASTGSQLDQEIAEFQQRISEAPDGGAGGARDDLGYGDAQADEPDNTTVDPTDLNPTLTDQDALDAVTSQNVLDELQGSGLDAGSFTADAPELGDVTTGVGDAGAFFPGIGGVGESGSASATSAANVANAASSAASVAATDFVPWLQSSYDTFTSAIATTELQLNDQLVDAQEAAATQLFGDGTFGSDVANAVFTASNHGIAEQEAALNQLLGVNLSADDLHNSLTADFDPETLSQSAAAQLVSPEDLGDILNALQSADLDDLITGVNWDDVFQDLISALF